MRRLLRAFWNVVTSPFRFIKWLVVSIARAVHGLLQKLGAFFTEEEEDTPLLDAFAKTVENPQGLLEHVDALRHHLLRAVVAVFVTSALSFTFVRYIMEFLARPLEGGLASLKAIEVTENVGTVMRVALLAGFALAFPYIVFEFFLFAAPGLKRRARLRGLFAIPVAVLFFLVGMIFAYYVLLPTALPFLFNFMDLTTEARTSSYFNFATGVLFWMGIFFEFPLAAYVLADIGLLKAQALIDQWRLAIVIIAVLAAAVTPTTDPITMALVMGPMVILYFLSIGLAFLAQRGRARLMEETDRR